MAFRKLGSNVQLKPLDAPTSPVNNYLGGGGGQQVNPLTAALSMGIISGDLTSSDASFIRDAYLGQQETPSQISKKKASEESIKQAYDRAKRLSTESLDIVNSGKNVSGFSIPQMLQERGVLPEWLPFWGLNEDRAALNAKLGQLSGITAFDEAGKALTATELGIVGGKVPTVSKGEGTNRQILNQLLNDIEAKRNEYLFSQVGL